MSVRCSERASRGSNTIWRTEGRSYSISWASLDWVSSRRNASTRRLRRITWSRTTRSVRMWSARRGSRRFEVSARACGTRTRRRYTSSAARRRSWKKWRASSGTTRRTRSGSWSSQWTKRVHRSRWPRSMVGCTWLVGTGAAGDWVLWSATTPWRSRGSVCRAWTSVRATRGRRSSAAWSTLLGGPVMGCSLASKLAQCRRIYDFRLGVVEVGAAGSSLERSHLQRQW